MFSSLPSYGNPCHGSNYLIESLNYATALEVFYCATEQNPAFSFISFLLLSSIYIASWHFISSFSSFALPEKGKPWEIYEICLLPFGSGIILMMIPVRGGRATLNTQLSRITTVRLQHIELMNWNWSELERHFSRRLILRLGEHLKSSISKGGGFADEFFIASPIM